MVSTTTSDAFPSHRPAPLAWKEFRRRSGFSTHPKVYVYDTSPQIVPNSPPITPLNLSPIINNAVIMGMGMESPRREQSGYFLSHVSQALQALGSSTGGNIADYIAANFNNEFGLPYEKGRKLHYMVNAILSSPKYKYLFLKDQILKDEKRSLWRLRKPEEQTPDEDTTVPSDMSLSALIPPTSPCLSLKMSRDEINDVMRNNNNNNNNNQDEVPTVPTPIASPFIDSSSSSTTECISSNNVPLSSLSCETYGGSDEDDKPPASASHTTENPLSLSSSLSPISPTTLDPSSPILSDTPSSLSSRRRKRKGLDSSQGVESPKMEEQGSDEKKRRLDLAA